MHVAVVGSFIFATTSMFLTRVAAYAAVPLIKVMATASEQRHI
jgi:hypothetical protein